MSLAMQLTVLLWAGAAMAQETGSQAAVVPSTMEMTIVGKSLKATDGKIYVNENCEIFPGLQIPISGKNMPRGLLDETVCHLESVNHSEHREEKADATAIERSDVEIREQEYVLQNTTAKPAIFAVLEQVPQGWKVDSDPQPVESAGENGDVAVFEVHAGPGELVRLHVGLRRTKELKPKALPGGP